MKKLIHIFDSRTIGIYDRWFMLLGIPMVSFLVPLIFFNISLDVGFKVYSRVWMGSLGYTLGYWLSNKALFIYLHKKFPFTSQTWMRISIMTVHVVLLNLIFKSISTNLEYLFQGLKQPSVLQLYSGGIFTCLFILAIYEAWYFMVEYKKQKFENEQIKKIQTQMQLNSLKEHINPHFLFNSLNTLISIIDQDNNVAIKFTEKLAKVYRFILTLKDEQFINLEKELAFCKDYIYLLKIRFEQAIEIEIPFIESSLATKKVIPLSIQSLIENAVKHNITSSSTPLLIQIKIDEEYVMVENNLQVKASVKSLKSGLKNLNQQYALLNHKKIKIEQNEFTFKVSLPLIN